MSGQIRFRRRSAWESADLGVKMVAQRPFFYFFLQLCTLLPIFVLISLPFYNNPTWVLLIVWWLKPAFEAGLVIALSKQVFGEPLNFSGSLKAAWTNMWRYRIVGDLLWRRFSMRRAVVLPVTVLEKVKGHEHATRRREIGYKTAMQSGWLTFFGANFESILLYGFMIVLGWLFFSPNHHFEVDPDGFFDSLTELSKYIFISQTHWSWHIVNFLYMVVLAFWTPFFVAANFSIYLQARTENEAWDIRLSFRQLAKRLGKVSAIILAVFLFSGSLNNTAYAETPPDKKQVQQTQKETIGSKPFVHLDTRKKFQSLKKTNKNKKDTELPSFSWALFAKSLLWAIGIALVGVMLYLLWRYIFPQMQEIKEKNKTPEKIFGLDIRKDRLPENPAAAAMKLFDSDPRAALSLLYRAVLVHLVHREKLILHDSMTESEVLNLLEKQKPAAALPVEKITKSWIWAAYAHILPDRLTMEDLCQNYAALSFRQPEQGVNNE
ncbi:MAG: hypothetical protein IJ143_05150 [Neisseriaceae bacterium]|nr:hypothetical protein [Neisseriaceae bacterium]